MINRIKINTVVEMWGTNDQRIGLRLSDDSVVFTVEVSIDKSYFIGDFYNK